MFKKPLHEPELEGLESPEFGPETDDSGFEIDFDLNSLLAEGGPRSEAAEAIQLEGGFFDDSGLENTLTIVEEEPDVGPWPTSEEDDEEEIFDLGELAPDEDMEPDDGSRGGPSAQTVILADEPFAGRPGEDPDPSVLDDLEAITVSSYHPISRKTHKFKNFIKVQDFSNSFEEHFSALDDSDEDVIFLAPDLDDSRHFQELTDELPEVVLNSGEYLRGRPPYESTLPLTIDLQRDPADSGLTMDLAVDTDPAELIDDELERTFSAAQPDAADQMNGTNSPLVDAGTSIQQPERELPPDEAVSADLSGEPLDRTPEMSQQLAYSQEEGVKPPVDDPGDFTGARLHLDSENINNPVFSERPPPNSGSEENASLEPVEELFVPGPEDENFSAFPDELPDLGADKDEVLDPAEELFVLGSGEEDYSSYLEEPADFKFEENEALDLTEELFILDSEDENMPIFPTESSGLEAEENGLADSSKGLFAFGPEESNIPEPSGILTEPDSGEPEPADFSGETGEPELDESSRAAGSFARAEDVDWPGSPGLETGLITAKEGPPAISGLMDSAGPEGNATSVSTADFAASSFTGADRTTDVEDTVESTTDELLLPALAPESTCSATEMERRPSSSEHESAETTGAIGQATPAPDTAVDLENRSPKPAPADGLPVADEITPRPEPVQAPKADSVFDEKPAAGDQALISGERFDSGQAEKLDTARNKEPEPAAEPEEGLVRPEEMRPKDAITEENSGEEAPLEPGPEFPQELKAFRPDGSVILPPPPLNVTEILALLEAQPDKPAPETAAGNSTRRGQRDDPSQPVPAFKDDNRPEPNAQTEAKVAAESAEVLAALIEKAVEKAVTRALEKNLSGFLAQQLSAILDQATDRLASSLSQLLNPESKK